MAVTDESITRTGARSRQQEAAACAGLWKNVCRRLHMLSCDMDPHLNPFSVLSWIIAPALLTNASTLLVLSIGNRLARAVDRGRELFKQLEDVADLTSPEAIRRLGEFTATEQRSLKLLAALRSVYIASGSFASATLVSLFGAFIVPTGAVALVRLLEVCAVAAGLVALSALIHASVVLIRETRIVVQVLQEQAGVILARAVPQGGRAV